MPIRKYLLTLLTITLSCFIISCSEQEYPDHNETGKKSASVSNRNYFIADSIAYSKLFLDSSDVTNFLSKNAVPDSSARRIISFYNTRNYQFAWFAEDGPTEPLRGFWNMYKYYITYEEYGTHTSDSLSKVIDRMLASEKSSWNEDSKQLQSVEMAVTNEFISFFSTAFPKGTIKRKEMERFIPYVQQDAISVADSLVHKKHKDGKYFDDANPAYGKLKKQMARYLEIQKTGGWPMLEKDAKKLKPGSNNIQVALLKTRLHISGDYPSADTSTMWNDTLTSAVKNVQERYGFTPDGTLDAAQITALNIPVEKRIAQMMVNLYRMQWDIQKPEGRYIEVNIPEYMMHVTDNGKKVFDMVVVVGKEGHNTTIFAGNLNQVVFAPYWNVPASIAKNEIAPAIAKNPNYLESKNMETVGEGGNVSYRQKPGPGNALGKVKFLFPNAYDIYFHDTPSKSLFSRDQRAFSHGCIRLEEPAKLANYLLEKETEWNSDKIADAMNSSEEKWVKLSKPVPVLITYYTSWVDEAGRLHFRDDIYDHDKEQEKRLFSSI